MRRSPSAVAMLTDGLDGRIARLTGSTSRVRRRARFPGGLHHFRSRPGSAGLRLGHARGAPDRRLAALRVIAIRRLLLHFPLLDLRRCPLGPLQRSKGSPAQESGPGAQEVFRGHADSPIRGSGRSIRAFFVRPADRELVARRSAVVRCVDLLGLPDDLELAVPEFQRADPPQRARTGSRFSSPLSSS